MFPPMDFRQRLLSYQELAAKVRALEQQVEAQRQARLARLPAEFGFQDLASFVRALRSAAQEKPNRARRVSRKRAARPEVTKPAAVVAPAVVAAAATAAPVAAPAPVASELAKPVPVVAPASAPAPALARPTGTSLDDPANFGLMPDRSVLADSDQPLAQRRERMAEALRFATRVLHTSKVPAAVWREWRQFERQLTEALRATLPTPDLDSV